jgi:hypothetical protein
MRPGELIRTRDVARLVFRVVQNEGISARFDKERTALGKLDKNSKEWTERKRAGGFSELRGHFTGELAHALRTKPYFDVTRKRRGSKGKGALIQIVFKEKELLDEVEHYVFYVPKTPNQVGALVVNTVMASMLQRAVNNKLQKDKPKTDRKVQIELSKIIQRVIRKKRR